MPVLDEYLSSQYKPGEALPVAILLQYNRTSGAYTIVFEDTDRTRWKITPANFETLQVELKPTV